MLLSDARPARPAQPSHPVRQDDEYPRHGSAHPLVWVAPHLGQRGILVTEQRTTTDWAEAMRQLAEAVVPQAERIVVVLDNLTPPTKGARYDVFPPAPARAIAAKPDLHDPPKHGSWLTMAERELSTRSRQALGGRSGTRADLERTVTAWVTARNAAATPIRWGFTIDDARRALRHVYPVPPQDKKR